ncbi:MAG: prepilin-type N-terminal cleavage/methylation domain-containing protein [Kiritimatiellae bacterium]|nr:prepilin-type N-terminal cleavage/methylation domain-containing protein [Kiritimatiellia bacterium]
MRVRGGSFGSKAGVTLVEVMLAGAITALVSLATLEGFIVAARIAHENAELLRADGVAFDLLWRRFYGDFDLLRSTQGQTPPLRNTNNDSDSPYRSTTLGNDRPDYNYRESVIPQGSGKLLAIDLQYGADGQFTRHLQVFRSDIPRTSN